MRRRQKQQNGGIVKQQRHDQDEAPHGGFIGGADQGREICIPAPACFSSNNNCESDQGVTMAIAMAANAKTQNLRAPIFSSGSGQRNLIESNAFRKRVPSTRWRENACLARYA